MAWARRLSPEVRVAGTRPTGIKRLARRVVSRAAAATLLISAARPGLRVSPPVPSRRARCCSTSRSTTTRWTGPRVRCRYRLHRPRPTSSACPPLGTATANPLASCTTATDAQGSGKLRLTSSRAGLEGGIFASTSVPTSQGLDVTFNSYQYGGSFGADGIAFVLAAVDPANPVTPSVIGQSGGSLGYSVQGTQPGLTHGYLGVGIDPFGNYSNKFEGTGCTDPANIAQRMPGQVVVRGPG